MKKPVAISLSYLLCAVVLIGIGLVSRHIRFLPPEVGDALWAMTVFCAWKVVLPRLHVRTTAIITLLTAYIVELSQLIRTPWLVSFRATTIGHLLLGQGFQWTDLLAYTIGVGLMWMASAYVCSRWRHTPVNIL